MINAPRGIPGTATDIPVAQDRGLVLDVPVCAIYSHGMKPISHFVSLHPYFKVHPGKLEMFKAGFPAFVEKAASEEKPPSSPKGETTACQGNLFYGFTVNGDEVFCREGYTDAEGLLAHLENVGAMSSCSD